VSKLEEAGILTQGMNTLQQAPDEVLRPYTEAQRQAEGVRAQAGAARGHGEGAKGAKGVNRARG
jgi:hypothetical protein